MAFEDIRNERIIKRETLMTKGIDPYPSKTERTHEIAALIKKFSAAIRLKRPIAVVGRIMARREHGGSTFIDIQDGSGKMQAYLKRDVLGDQYDLFFDVVDIGDIIQIKGRAFETQRKEKTLEVASWSMLAKSLRPLPEKWHGLQDVEERFRKRYLDLLMNADVRMRFIKRTQVLRAIRAFFDREGFMEVETPIFHPIAGGALAKPFRTHHNALDIDLYLRIAPELYLKQLLIGGFEKVYEIGKSFRNEGIDASHNPEFTSIEWYASYWDEEAMMDCVQRCFAFILKECGTKNIEFDGKEISFAKFARFDFKEILQRYALIADYDRETRDSLAQRALQLGIDTSPHESKGKIADEIYKKICRPYLVQPTFIINHPLDISPLAKKRTIDTVRRFQLVIGGLEMANGFSELNDPLDQRERFEAQQQMNQEGEEEAHPFDEAFVEALEYGMPPAAGVGIGIDRLIMFLTGTKNIREVVLFPTMRPRI